MFRVKFLRAVGIFSVMKVWQLTSPKQLERVTVPNLELTKDEVKVKVTKALLTETDVAVYSGAIKVKAPFIPGKFAIGQVTEANEDSFVTKGTRVYLATVTEDKTAAGELQIAGETTDGFYRDFVLMNTKDVYPLPPSVSDDAAFLIDSIALSEHVVDALNVKAGQRILVLGGGLVANVLCQVLIYHNAVPILADNNAERLARARRSGIHYTFANDETLKKNIMSITGSETVDPLTQNVANATGGTLADGAVYLASNNRCEPSVIFPLVKRDACVAFCSMAGKSLSIDLEYMMKNNISVKGISESRKYVATAINLLANKVITFSEFPFKTHNEEALPNLMKQYMEQYGGSGMFPEQFDVVKFIF